MNPDIADPDAVSKCDVVINPVRRAMSTRTGYDSDFPSNRARRDGDNTERELLQATYLKQETANVASGMFEYHLAIHAVTDGLLDEHPSAHIRSRIIETYGGYRVIVKALLIPQRHLPVFDKRQSKLFYDNVGQLMSTRAEAARQHDAELARAMTWLEQEVGMDAIETLPTLRRDSDDTDV